MLGVGEMAAAVVALLAPYVAKGGEELAKKVGAEVGSRVVKLWDVVRAKLSSSRAAEDLADFEQAPEDQANQGALVKDLRKALDADPAFRDEVMGLLREIEAKGGQPITQIASTVGDYNVTTQVVGSSNIMR